MFKTLRTLFKIIVYLFRSRKELKIAQKLDKEGNLVERDKIVDTKVPDWAKFCIDATGSSVNVKGEELIPTDRAVVFIANHQGNMDIPTLLGFIKKPKAFVSKIEILKVPILSKWMALMQCTFLDRKNMRQSVQAMAEAVETIKKGYSLVIFPEGTRSKGGPVKEFKAGSFKLAFKSGAPIVPVTIDGTWRILEETGHIKPAQVKITIHKPIFIENLSKEELHAIPAQVQKTVESCL